MREATEHSCRQRRRQPEREIKGENKASEEA